MATRLSNAHIERQAQLRGAVTGSITRIWDDLPGYNRENVDEWLSLVLPVVLASQSVSVALTDAYVARFMGRRPLGINAQELIGAAARKGADPAEVYQRPFVTLWSKLGEGMVYEEAANAALARATGTAAMDMQLAMRGAADAIEQADDGMYGYQRVADASACEFCQAVDGAYVKSGDAMALHNNCGCGLEPLTAPHPGAAQLPSGVAVREHGEMGPVLTSPDHDFITQTDI